MNNKIAKKVRELNKLISMFFIIITLTNCSNNLNNFKVVNKYNDLKIEILNKVIDSLSEKNEIDSSKFTRFYVYPFYNYISENQIINKKITINRNIPINQLKSEYENSFMINDLNVYIENEKNIIATVLVLERKNSTDYSIMIDLIWSNGFWRITKFVKLEEPIQYYFK